MARYKGVELEPSLLGLVPHMAGVESYRETLQGLQGVWDSLTLLGQLSGTGTDMGATRQAFQQLTGSLLDNLARETLRKTILEMKSKAQVAVDIMVRNLFERTADIGFLATDEQIVDYLERLPALEEHLVERARRQLQARFRAYVRKYSVYADILLLDSDGRVVAQLDETHPVELSRDPLIAEAMTTRATYVETFRASDLQPQVERPLIYAYRVGSAQGRVLGVLCLCFRFDNETDRIFASLVKPSDWSVVALLDAQGRVIASSDAWHVPVGAPLERVQGADWRVVRFAGCEYLATTRPTQGYQGYMGPGWYGHVMLPLEHAFDEIEAADILAQVDEGVMASVMANPDLFAKALHAIPMQAARIQSQLNRSVWNGNVRHRNDSKSLNPAFSKVLLWEISNTGIRTKDVFEHSIDNLHATVVSTILHNCRFLASLAIDIMDRNLYERANDCRWWALTPSFRATLAGGSARDMGSVLAYINGLYTVYANLLVFDREGRVVAVSHHNATTLRGTLLNQDWVKQTLNLRDEQGYAVSDFTATDLYGGLPTYIYGAAIRSPDDTRVVGGIGIVFDAAPQFLAMLRDALPRDDQGDVQRGSFAVFAQPDRRVIAATRDDLPPGSRLDLPSEYFNVNAEHTGIVEFAGEHYAVGASPSRGYREYKGDGDPYRNSVTALVFVPLGAAQSQARRANDAQAGHHNLAKVAHDGVGESIEIATFYVAGQWFGVRSECVVEAIDVKAMTSVPGTLRNLFGYIMFRDQVMVVINLAVLMGIDLPIHAALDGCMQVVVMRDGDGQVGLLVEQLGEIPEVPIERIERLPPMIGGENQLAESVVKKSNGETGGEMLVILSVERIRARIHELHVPENLTAGEAGLDLTA